MSKSLTGDSADVLVSAVKADDVQGVKRALDGHPALRAVLNDPLPGLAFGSTVLGTAVTSGNRDMVDLLLGAGAEINVKSHWWAGGFGVLDVCHPDFAPFLLERGAAMTAYSASRLGRLDDLRRLVEGDPARVYSRGGDGQTPLHVAANVEIARFLIEHGADMDALDVDHESTPAQYAIRERQDVARYLVGLGCRTDILMAAALGDVTLVQRFLDDDPSSVQTAVTAEYFPMRDERAGGSIYIWTLGTGRTAHAIAREFGHDDVLRLLMSRTPESLKFVLACESGDVATVREMLAANPVLLSTLTDRERQAIASAARCDETEAVRLMLSVGWPVDAREPHGGSALHWAAMHGNVEMTRALLQHGASVTLEDGRFHAAPLGWALHGSQNARNRENADHAATVEALLAAGAALPEEGEVDASEAVRAVVGRRREQKQSEAKV